MYQIRKKVYGNYRLTIKQDLTTPGPRTWDNLGIMVCLHSRYDLPNELNINKDHFNSWPEIKKDIKQIGGRVILPLYLYVHSGLRIKTTSFYSRWDSGRVGFIFTTEEKIKNHFQTDRINKEIKTKAKKILKSEVDIYNQYLAGNVYGYTIDFIPTGVIVDSCWGFYDINRLIETATNRIKRDRKKRINKKTQKLKTLILNNVSLETRQTILNKDKNYWVKSGQESVNTE